jgi:hypothetical protein
MIVIIAGMYRSGSTFSFNIVRESLDGEVDVISDNSVPADRLLQSPGRHLLVKAHLPDPALMELIADGRAKCICTYRKPEEAVASWMEAFGFSFESSVETIRQWLEWRRTLTVPILNIAYETIEDHPLRSILLIQRYVLGHVARSQARELRQRYDKAQLKQEYDALTEGDDTVNIGMSYYNAKTFFHRKHISSADKRDVSTTLNSEQIAIARSAFGEYGDDTGG